MKPFIEKQKQKKRCYITYPKLQGGWAGIQASVDSSLKANTFKPYIVFQKPFPKAL